MTGKPKFLVFSGEYYYPRGGWEDFSGVYESREAAIDAAKQAVKSRRYDWAQAVDLSTRKIICDLPEPAPPKKIRSGPMVMWVAAEDPRIKSRKLKKRGKK